MPRAAMIRASWAIRFSSVGCVEAGPLDDLPAAGTMPKTSTTACDLMSALGISVVSPLIF